MPALLRIVLAITLIVRWQAGACAQSTPDATKERDAWQAAIVNHLGRSVRAAGVSARNQDGTAVVKFSLDRFGSVGEVALERSSGISELDRDSIAVVRAASPFPAPPATVPGESFSFVVPIEFRAARPNPTSRTAMHDPADFWINLIPITVMWLLFAPLAFMIGKRKGVSLPLRLVGLFPVWMGLFLLWWLSLPDKSLLERLERLEKQRS